VFDTKTLSDNDKNELNQIKEELNQLIEKLKIILHTSSEINPLGTPM